MVLNVCDHRFSCKWQLTKREPQTVDLWFFTYLYVYVRTLVPFILLCCVEIIIRCIVKIILAHSSFESLKHYEFIFVLYNLLCYRIPSPISVNGNNRTCKT